MFYFFIYNLRIALILRTKVHKTILTIGKENLSRLSPLTYKGCQKPDYQRLPPIYQILKKWLMLSYHKPF